MTGVQTVVDDVLRLVRDADAVSLPEIAAALKRAEIELLVRLQRVGPQHDVGGQARPEQPPSDVNLSAEIAAKRLGVSVDWLYKKAATLPFARRIGRRVLFSERGLDRWNRQQTLTA
jgi:hypothetical protein